MTEQELYRREMHHRYLGYMSSDLGFLSLQNGKYDLINGNINNHLCEIGAFIRTYREDRDFLEEYAKLIKLYTDKLIEVYPEDSDIWYTMRDSFARDVMFSI